ncbi:MAG: DUF1015 family protein [Armatimonadota bacterium]
MADLAPFRAVMYNPRKVGDLGAVTAPPYDVLSPEDCLELRRKHALYLIGLILWPYLGEDNGRYEEAGRTWRRWLSDGTLVVDERPAFYLYQQDFGWEGRRYRRRGLVCLVRLHSYEDGVILPHEQTIASHKQDRYKLLEATRANLDSVFGVYDEQRGVVSELVAQASTSEPILSVEADGETHTVWRIDNPSLIMEITLALAHEPIVIADGHHRYETALTYRMNHFLDGRERQLAADYVLMTLCSAKDPGLLVLPTHRVVKLSEGAVRSVSPVQLAERLAESLAFAYDVEECLSLDHLCQHLRDASVSRSRAFGVCLAPDVFVLLRWRSSAPSDPAEDIDVLRRDVLGLLPDLIGCPSIELAYTQSASQAAAEVYSEKAVMAVLVNPVPVADVFRTALTGRRLPEKSTYFHPKLRSGLIMRSLEH